MVLVWFAFSADANGGREESGNKRIKIIMLVGKEYSPGCINKLCIWTVGYQAEFASW